MPAANTSGIGDETDIGPRPSGQGSLKLLTMLTDSDRALMRSAWPASTDDIALPAGIVSARDALDCELLLTACTTFHPKAVAGHAVLSSWRDA
jgi:hypothetical protein